MLSVKLSHLKHIQDICFLKVNTVEYAVILQQPVMDQTSYCTVSAFGQIYRCFYKWTRQKPYPNNIILCSSTYPSSGLPFTTIRHHIEEEQGRENITYQCSHSGSIQTKYKLNCKYNTDSILIKK